MSSTPNSAEEVHVTDAGALPRWVILLFAVAFVLLLSPRLIYRIALVSNQI